MIDLTPLEVRKKKGDFRRAMRGYEAEAVDDFLDIAADRLEALVRENAALRERADALSQALEGFRDRERAMNEALVSAQQLREEVRTQAGREAELLLREARIEADRVVAEAQNQAAAATEALGRIQAQRSWYLRAFRALVERQMGEIEQEEERLREPPRAEPAAERESYSNAEQELPPAPEPAEAGWLSSIDGVGRSAE